MTNETKNYSFLFGRFVIRADAFHRLNLFDVFWELLHHAARDALEVRSENFPTTKRSFRARNRYVTTHLDRHDTAFWIVTEGDLSRTIVHLANG